jgi:hypothetical protein
VVVKNAAWKVFEFLASLKLAVIVLLSLVFSLATATTLESLYDTPTAKFYVYQSWWFHALLGFLGVNIFCSAMSRWPWKPRLYPFVVAHIGILTLLFGSWVTERYGIDGNLRVSEGDTSSEVDLDTPLLVLTEGEQTVTMPIRWIPPGATFKPLELRKEGLPYDLVIDKFVSHADANFSFVANTEARTDGSAPSNDPAATTNPVKKPAIRLKLTGGPMKITQDFWLWDGDPGWSGFQAGPAWLELRKGNGSEAVPPRSTQGPRFTVFWDKDGSVAYRAESSTGELVKGKLAAGKINGTVLDPKWKGNVRVELAEWIPDAMVSTDYKVSRLQYGAEAPPSAIHIVVKGNANAETWLGIGTRALMKTGPHQVEIGYFNRRIILPFEVKLNRFTVEHYEGSQKPASYASEVTITGGDLKRGESIQRKISMNEPVKNSGITLYQASYEDAEPRPVTSIFAVNQDPGRPYKYAGSLLIVLGTIWLFGRKYQLKRKTAV